MALTRTHLQAFARPFYIVNTRALAFIAQNNYFFNIRKIGSSPRFSKPSSFYNIVMFSILLFYFIQWLNTLLINCKMYLVIS